VTEDHRSGGAANEAAEYVARMDLDPGERSARHARFGQDTVSHIEREHPEFLYRRGRQTGPVVRPDIGRVAEKSATFGSSSGRPSTKLKRGLDDCGTGWTNPCLGAQFGFGGIAKTTEISQPLYQIMRDLQDILAFAAAAQEDGDKLHVREGAGATVQKPFARSDIGSESKKSRHK